MSLRTTVLGQMSEIRELHDADRRKQAVTLETLKADHRRSAEMRELRTTDSTRQQHLIQTLTIMQSLQREMSLNNDLRGPNRLHNWYQSLVALDLGSTRLKEQQMAFVFTAAVKRLNEYRELTVGMYCSISTASFGKLVLLLVFVNIAGFMDVCTAKTRLDLGWNCFSQQFIIIDFMARLGFIEEMSLNNDLRGPNRLHSPAQPELPEEAGSSS
ncbi:hypothetical protein Tco_0953956 [Tanacetum coccineum]|uniref:Uncharacterized protein n=1 Tax=Tanacetum coccineum TaxID=301880 RepID=A0ABQ5E3J6_9ASTR